MNNILVTGSTGQLGSDVVKELLKRGYSTLSPNRSEFNLCSEDSIRNYILNSNCEAIVHCAAYTQVDKAEDEKDLWFCQTDESTAAVPLSCDAEMSGGEAVRRMPDSGDGLRRAACL